MFGYTIERDGSPAVLIFVRRAAENQMTLYYQNLFRILCGLVESALGRAFDYEAVAQDKRCVDGTCVLKQAAFGQELAAAQALADGKMGSFCSCVWCRAWSLSASWWAQLGRQFVRATRRAWSTATCSTCLCARQRRAICPLSASA